MTSTSRYVVDCESLQITNTHIQVEQMLEDFEKRKANADEEEAARVSFLTLTYICAPVYPLMPLL
jgi:hypothetical protein